MKIFSIAGYSGSGKTTLIERLIPCFTASGLVVSVIKHAHHSFDIDRPGKDSYRHREAGAKEVMLTGGARWALLHENRGEAEPSLDEYLSRFSPCDLVLVEGFKHEAVPKLEVYRPAQGKSPLWPDNPHVIAVASDIEQALVAPEARHSARAAPPVWLRLDDTGGIAAFILKTLSLVPRNQGRF
ncbi:MAG: molybdopterin-guanine dinucleotide biosynthesis protein B [Betaproteobacteria bacterium]|nr:molybdopterin-guanine dinucleotide biosynthesis protein B [Betaproteobacteria bacterium]